MTYLKFTEEELASLLADFLYYLEDDNKLYVTVNSTMDLDFPRYAKEFLESDPDISEDYCEPTLNEFLS